METKLLDTKFARIGARLRVTQGAQRPRHFGFVSPGPIQLDIATDRDGEYFALRARDELPPIEVLDVQPRDRHLLLLVRDNGEKSKYLCGHDERHWFVAGIPESASVGTVRQAKEALKPPGVRAAQAKMKLRGRHRESRKNAAYRRQGEWFFLPAPELKVDPALVRRNEPLSRGNGGKPHWAEFCYRFGGEQVFVCKRYPAGLARDAYDALLKFDPGAQSWGWRPMVRNPGVLVKGRIRHPDHQVITLHCWHRVLMNTENESRAMQHVTFLD
jgi:hypothetical protein